MTFDITGFLKLVSKKTDEYMLSVLDDITTKNPEFLQRLKEDKELFNEDGSPKMNMSQEVIDQKIKEIINDVDFKDHVLTKESVYKAFLIDEKLLDKFIIE